MSDMEKYGVIIVGASVNPIIISLNNLIEKGMDKIYLLGTMDNSYANGKKIIKGTESICDRIKDIFSEIDIEKIIIDRSNIKDMKDTIDKNILSKMKERESYEKMVYLDYTGGTKIQSSFISQYFLYQNIKNFEVIDIYINSDSKKIIEGNKQFTIPLSKINGANSMEIIRMICKVKGFDYDTFIDKFESVKIEEYIIEFDVRLKNKLENKNKNKSKVKMEMFEAIYTAEKVGEEFCKINFIVPNGEKETYENTLLGEMLGIKKEQYNNRINFEDECDEEEE